jgi:CBS domain-containing protein
VSPRAASRLESLGFTQVYDYVAGKADWGSAGLPLEGEDGSATRAGAYVRTDVPACRLEDDLEGVRRRVRGAGWDTCLVVDEERVVLGRLGRAVLDGTGPGSVEEVMTPGPSTIRPSARLGPTVERMRSQNLSSLPVTSSDGRLVGLLVREQAEEALRGLAG